MLQVATVLEQLAWMLRLGLKGQREKASPAVLWGWRRLTNPKYHFRFRLAEARFCDIFCKTKVNKEEKRMRVHRRITA